MQNGEHRYRAFCTRRHATLLYKCPACAATQRHGGACDKCGVDFAKYAAMLISQESIRAEREREKIRSRAGMLKQGLLAPHHRRLLADPLPLPPQLISLGCYRNRLKSANRPRI